MRKLWTIPGGIHPPENKHQSVHLPIGTIPLPREIILPLNQHIGAPSEPIVEVGQQVLKGQLVAKAQGVFSAGVHASTSGTVSAVEDRLVPHPSGLSSRCVVIEPDGQDRWAPLEPCENFAELDHFELVERIRTAGIAGLGGAGFPTAVKVNPRSNDRVEILILNGTECEPYITADDMLMRERAADIIAGAQLLAKIVGHPKEILVGIEDNKPEAIAAMEAAAAGTPVEIVSFPTKYPSGGEKQLIQILTGKEVPSGKIPAQIGVLVQNVGTAAAAYRAIRFGEPLISRVTTVVGQALGEERNIDVLIGTPIDHVLQLHGFRPKQSARLIIGGPMMGYTIEQAAVPVVKTTNCILVPSQAEMPEPPPAQPCIRCGLCAEACPASLLPQQLFWYSKADDHEKLDAHNIFDCIECGACSYVCPSSIPLVQYYRASKGSMRQQAAEKEKADKARRRFEFRQERIAKAEAEKEAKRLARKQAAEEAKKKLAEDKVGSTPGKDAAKHSRASDPVAEAMARAKIQAADPTAQTARLERALSSAKSRVEHARQQLEDVRLQEDQSRMETLAASLKQAEQKAQDAEARLRDFAAQDKTDGKPSVTGAESAGQKLANDPQNAQQQVLETLRKRLATAREKLRQAEERESSTADALRQGVEKLEGKLRDAEAAPLAAQPEGIEDTTLSAAEAAIAKARAKAAAQADMTDEEKSQAQLEALRKRLAKAQQRLLKAEQENDENIAAFRAGVEKLETKLAEMETADANPNGI
jgi:electron transport complex protein RnfC